MKNDTRQLLRYLKTAAILGNPEAVDLALNGLLGFHGIAANDRMDDGFIEKTILPVGRELTPLKTSFLRPLISHRLVAGRAIGAVALADQFLAGKQATAKDLHKPANDPRLEVRKALGRELMINGNQDLGKLQALAISWLTNTASKSRYTALIFAPALAISHGELLIDLLTPFDRDSDWDVRAVLVDALNKLGQAGLGESVMELLYSWASDPNPNSWVISRVLSASWSAAYPAQTRVVLAELSLKNGTESQVKSAVEALSRHGVEINKLRE
jgi:HEAT repeat protein